MLIRARRRAIVAGSARARLWTTLLVTELVLTIVIGLFIVVFNYSNAPVFEQLRKIPYIGRMGTLLEVDNGTGLVRRLIWVGDDKAGGAVALITSDPIRAVIGWGPESMFVVYNRFYPPSLANIEARGASPDRSHEAYLDELINKGAIGLASHLFVLFSVIMLARTLIRRSDDIQVVLASIAAIATVVGHAIEGFTGIPIVASLMLLWITIAIVVVSGKFVGENGATSMEIAPEVPPPAPQRQAPRGAKRGHGAVARGAAQTRAPQSSRSTPTATTAIYALMFIIAGFIAWNLNIDSVYADMRFQQGQNYTESPNGTIETQIAGTSYFLDALRMEPDQDFYFLSLGRSLMSIADLRVVSDGAQVSSVPAVQLADLLRIATPEELQTFVMQKTPGEIVGYARAVLERAHALSPLNKDHSANLARLQQYTYARITRDPADLDRAIEWYRRANQIAPQDVSILNEYVAATGLRASITEDTTKQAALFQEANELLARSRALDARYTDTNNREAELLRLQGRLAEVTDRYIALIERDPHALDANASLIIQSLKSQPEQLNRLRDAIAKQSARAPTDAGLLSLLGLMAVRTDDLPAAEAAYAALHRLQPENIDALQNYTLVLSDMQRYTQAAAEAQKLVDLAQKQQIGQQDQSILGNLLNYLQTRAQQK